MAEQIRLSTETDINQLSEIYRDTVIALGPQLYTADQVRAWSSSPDDEARFREWILSARTHVLEIDGEIAGYCGVTSEGHVTSLYVASRHSRKGVGSRVLRHAMADARARGIHDLHTEASFFSRPVFARHGFWVDYEETVLYGGVEFRRFVMRCRLVQTR